MKNKGGRPALKDDPKQWPVIVGKLKDAFALGSTIEEACLYAGIAKTTFYDSFRTDTEMLDDFEALQESPMLLARKAWINAFNLEPKLARDYAVRRKAGEFGGRNRRRTNQFDHFRTKATPKRTAEIENTLRKLGVLLTKNEDIKAKPKKAKGTPKRQGNKK